MNINQIFPFNYEIFFILVLHKYEQMPLQFCLEWCRLYGSGESYNSNFIWKEQV